MDEKERSATWLPHSGSATASGARSAVISGHDLPPDSPAFIRALPGAREPAIRPYEGRSRRHTTVGASLGFATCGANDAGGLNAVVTIGRRPCFSSGAGVRTRRLETQRRPASRSRQIPVTKP